MNPHPVPRSPYVAVPNPSGVLRAGAARVDITPPPGVPCAGSGIWGSNLIDRVGRLFATALVIEQATGGRVALVGVDLHSCTRYLCEQVATQTAGAGLSVDRVLLGPTHTHRGPGGFYADLYFDKNLGSEKGFFKEVADALADGIAAAILGAVGSLQEAVVGHADVPLWGYARNRSFGGFRANGEGARHFTQRKAGIAAPANIRGRRAALDPRVRVTCAFEKDSRFPIGLFAALPCHNTTHLPMRTELSADWMGWAAMNAADRIAEDTQLWTRPDHTVLPADQRPRIDVGAASGVQGDVNAHRPLGVDGMYWARRSGRLMREVGRAYGGAIHQAMVDARAAATDAVGLEVRFEEVDATANGLEPEGKVGMVTLGGSDGARAAYQQPEEQLRVVSENALMRGASRLVGRLYPEPRAAFWNVPNRPHFPKIRMPDDFAGWLPPLADLLEHTQGVPNKVFVQRILSVGDRHWFTIPGEATSHLASVLEKAVADELSGSAALVGLTGDYLGYLTTAEEYDTQHYEGSTNLYGRDTGSWLEDRLAQLAAGVETAPPIGTVSFPYTELKTLPAVMPVPNLLAMDIHANGNALEGWWRAGPEEVPPGPWIALEVFEAGAWTPVRWKHAPVDDATRPFVFRRHYAGAFTLWAWYYALPPSMAAALDGKPVRAVLLPLGWAGGPSGGWPSVDFHDTGVQADPMPEDRAP